MGKESFYGERDGYGGFVQLHSYGEVDFALLKKHADTKRVSLREVPHLDNLDFLSVCSHLEEVSIYGWKIDDFSALAKLPNLKFLFLNGGASSRLENFDFISNILSLERLHIIRYPTPTYFPNLQNLDNLISVEIATCKRLSDLSNILRIPNLQGFGIHSTPHEVEDLEFIAAKPGMKVMNGQFGSKKKNDDFDAMLKKYGLHHGHIIQNRSISCSIGCPICKQNGK